MALSDLHLLVHDVSDLFFFFFLIVLVRVDSSSQRCVRTVSLERDPESAVGLWLCVKAGWASCWCRIHDPGSVVLLRHSFFHSLSCCLAIVALADVSARLVHKAELLFSPNTCVCLYIKSDLFFPSLSRHTRLKYNQHTQINI